MTEPASMPAHRPLSPHLQIYHWSLSMALSILHRATGVGLVAGVVVLVWWLIAAAWEPAAFATTQALLNSWIGRLCLMGWSWALCFHLCSGLRHVVWDMGFGFSKEASFKSGLLVVAASGAFTLIVWAFGFGLV